MHFSMGGVSYVVTSGGRGEKSDFGRETVPQVDCSGSVRLNGTTVTGKVDAGGSINAVGANVGKLDAGGSINLTETTCHGKVDAGGSINATNSQAKMLDAGGSVTVVGSKISHGLDAGGSVTANRCEQIGTVKAGGSANLDECPSVRSVSTGSHATIRDTTVLEDVSAGSDATIRNSKIGRTLSCSSNHLVIEGSEIDTIDLHSAMGVSITSGGMSFGRGGVFMGGGSVVVSGGASVSMVSIGGRTTSVMIDGVPLDRILAARTSATASDAGEKQVIELRNSKVRNIIFEGGRGEVILSGESSVTGSIAGGKIKE